MRIPEFKLGGKFQLKIGQNKYLVDAETWPKQPTLLGHQKREGKDNEFELCTTQ